MKKLLLLSVVLVCVMAMHAQAAFVKGDRILVDICKTYTGDTDSSGRQWNRIDNVGVGGTAAVYSLVNTANEGTSVDIIFTAGTGGTAKANNYGPDTSSLTDYPDFATKDGQYLTSDVSTSTCEFKDLDISLTYDLTVWGARGVLDPISDRFMQVTIGGVSKSYNASGTIGEGLVTFTGLSPDATGRIVIELIALTDGAGSSYVNTFDITAVPEPATLSLLAAGGLGVVLCRKR